MNFGHINCISTFQYLKQYSGSTGQIPLPLPLARLIPSALCPNVPNVWTEPFEFLMDRSSCGAEYPSPFADNVYVWEADFTTANPYRPFQNFVLMLMPMSGFQLGQLDVVLSNYPRYHEGETRLTMQWIV